MSFSVTIPDADIRKALGNVRQYTEKQKAGLRRALAETVIAVDNKAKNAAPVDTGHMRRNIHPEFSPDRLGAVVTAPVEYSHFVEFGTRFMRARPFMNPAAESERRPFVRRVKKYVGEVAP